MEGEERGIRRMSIEELEKVLEALPAWMALSAGLLLLAWQIHAGHLPWVRFRTPNQPAEPAYWEGVDLLFIVSVWFLSQFALTAIGSLVGDELAVPRVVALLLAQVASGLLVYMAIDQRVRVVHGQSLAALGFRASPGNFLPTILLLVLVWIPLETLMVAWNVFLALAFAYEPQAQQIVESYQSTVATGDLLSIGSFLVSAGLVAPVVEESIFRGFLYGGLRVRVGKVLGAVVTSLVFAIFHGSLSAFLPLVVLSGVLCYLYERTGSLCSPIVFHALFNGTTLIRLLLVGAGEADSQG
jgi:membrane protease YdiL (CAAX protease family)